MARKPKQGLLFKTEWKHRQSHGGELRKLRVGRGARPLSTRYPLHLVLKSNLAAIPRGLRHPRTFALVNEVFQKYAKRFFVSIEQICIERDHIHCLIRCSRRSMYQSFFKVVAGQIAQRVTGTLHETYNGPRVWKHRPFSRVVIGYRAWQTVRNYIQLNEKEARGERPYRKQRLKGLTPEQIADLWRN